MHKIKKAAANAKGAENAEYVDYKNRLEMVAAYLCESSTALQESQRAWQDVCHQQKSFADKFALRYPDKDEVRNFAKASSVSSQKLVKNFVLKSESRDAPHWQVHEVVQDYLKEITDVSSEYGAVTDAAKEVAMYTKKVDDLQGAKKKVDEAKVSRNMEKLNDCREKYEQVLDRVVDRMKMVYNKRQVALKATYVAYWSSQLRAFNMIDSSLEETREFVESSVENLSTIKIRSLTAEDVAQFREVHCENTPTSSPKSAADDTAVVADKTVPMSPVDGTEEVPADPLVAAI